MEKIRCMTEKCSSLDGFVLNYSVGGGAGSGLGSMLLEELTEEYNKFEKTCINIFTYAPLQTYNFEPYNALLACSQIMQYADASVILENGAYYHPGKASNL